MWGAQTGGGRKRAKGKCTLQNVLEALALLVKWKYCDSSILVWGPEKALRWPSPHGIDGETEPKCGDEPWGAGS